MELNELLPNLIYTDKNRIDQGVIKGYEFDLAYGTDENSFTLTVPRNSYFIESGALIYIENTEYGGIVDSLTVNSENNTFVYGGRTWHGILASKIVRPEIGQDYFTIMQKDGNQAIDDVLTNIGENGTKVVDGYMKDEYGNLILKDFVLTHYKFTPNPMSTEEAEDYDTYENADMLFRYADEKSDAMYMNFRGNEFGYFSAFNPSTKVLVISGSGVTMDYREWTYNYVGDDEPVTIDCVDVYGVQYVTYKEYNLNDDTLFYPDIGNDIEFSIAEYNARYTDAYSTMLQMLYENNMKLTIEFPCEINGQKVNACKVSAGVSINYADDDEWNLRNQNFSAKQTTNRINHIIALGQGNLKDRYVLDVYADADGGIIEENAEVFHSEYERMYTGFKDGHFKLMLQYKAENDASVLVKHMTDGIVYGLCNNALYEANRVSDDSYTFTDGQSVSHTLSIPDNLPDYDVLLAKVYDVQYDRTKIDRLDDYAEVLDSPSADFRDTYLRLIYQPYDFSYHYNKYFEYDADNDSYSEIEPIVTYSAMSSQPSNWTTAYSNYYEISNGAYATVSGVNQPQYKQCYTMPSDWALNYSNYKIMKSDGTTFTYESVSGEEVKDYKLQTVEPTDWVTNYATYFYKGTGYVANTKKTWKANKYYYYDNNKYTKLKSKPDDWKTGYRNYFVKSSGFFNVTAKKGRAPKWSAKKYYTYKTVNTIAPNFATLSKKNLVMQEIGQIVNTPAFVAGKYYSKTEIAPRFAIGLYYEVVTDHYASLYENAVEKLKDYADSDKIEMELSADYDYDVMDVVGCTDEQTDLEIKQPITKKIVKIKGNKKTVTYEIGG